MLPLCNAAPRLPHSIIGSILPQSKKLGSGSVADDHGVSLTFFFFFFLSPSSSGSGVVSKMMADFSGCKRKVTKLKERVSLA